MYAIGASMSAVWAGEVVTTLRNISNHSPNGAMSRPRSSSSQQHTWWGLPFTVRRTVGCRIYPATDFPFIPLSSRTCSDGPQHSKLIMPASHSAVAVSIHCSWSHLSPDNTKILSQFVPFTLKQSIQSMPPLPQSLLLAILTSSFLYYYSHKDERTKDDKFFDNSLNILSPLTVGAWHTDMVTERGSLAKQLWLRTSVSSVHPKWPIFTQKHETFFVTNFATGVVIVFELQICRTDTQLHDLCRTVDICLNFTKLSIVAWFVPICQQLHDLCWTIALTSSHPIFPYYTTQHNTTQHNTTQHNIHLLVDAMLMFLKLQASTVLSHLQTSERVSMFEQKWQ